jgi:hypothetical protein
LNTGDDEPERADVQEWFIERPVAEVNIFEYF